MGLTKGHFYSLHSDKVPDQIVWFDGMVGTTRKNLTSWQETNNQIRSLIHKPIKTSENDMHANFSAFMWLLGDLGKNNWGTKPIIIDPYGQSGNYFLDLDDLKGYGARFIAELKPTYKPLLRLIPSTWGSWMENSQDNAYKLLDYFDLIMVEPGLSNPSKYQTPSGKVYPRWFEYVFGLVAYDATGQWLESPQPKPEPIEEPEPTPQPNPQPIDTSVEYEITGNIWFMPVNLTIKKKGG